jgi:hypothetical protein
MPTVLRYNGFEVMIYTHDHLPRHVHVFDGQGEVIINLEDLSIREVRGMRARDVRRALELVAQNQEVLVAKWDEIGPVA